MRRYGLVLVAALAGAALVSALLRMPRSAETPRVAAAVAETTLMNVDVFSDRVVAAPESLGVGRTVRLAVINRAARAVRVKLTGYEDRVDSGDLAPDSTWHATFIADRPGEQFAWLVNGEPRGRLDIRGSHLVEGHR